MKLGWGEIANAFGNGDENEGVRILSYLTMHIRHARSKHPFFAEGAYQAIGVIHGEYKELEHAVEHETKIRCKAEGGDLVAAVIRFLNGEHTITPPEDTRRQSKSFLEKWW